MTEALILLGFAVLIVSLIAWMLIPFTKREGVWSEAFDKLQVEKKQYGMGTEYWRIWYKEVCPAYRRLVGSSLVKGKLEKQVLEDMEKHISERRYF